jgi:hypothetical protein
MAKIWVLDTETKGTGANMVPLEDVRAKSKDRREPIFVPPPRRERAPEEPTPRKPPRFKVVDVMTAQALAEGADGRETLAVLKTVRSVVDVRVSVWDDEAQRWRVLTPAEQRALWDLRARAGS